MFILGVLTRFAVPLSAQKADEDEAALRGLWGQFERAFNQYDAKGVASLYAPDGDRIDANFELARGRAEIANQYGKDLQGGRPMSPLSLSTPGSLFAC